MKRGTPSSSSRYSHSASPNQPIERTSSPTVRGELRVGLDRAGAGRHAGLGGPEAVAALLDLGHDVALAVDDDHHRPERAAHELLEERLAAFGAQLLDEAPSLGRIGEAPGFVAGRHVDAGLDDDRSLARRDSASSLASTVRGTARPDGLRRRG